MPRDDVTIRPLRSAADYSACVALQREVWGADFADVVPPSILTVAQRLGGVALGGFAPEERLVGFVFGLTGMSDGRPVHWSDMLAVHPDARGTGLARRLKESQRDIVRAAGVDEIRWTYDPLVARNAHLNLNVFGVRVDEYVPDMYLDTGSDLHAGIGTDRLVVSWSTAVRTASEQAALHQRASSDASFDGAPIVTPDAPLPDDWNGCTHLRVGVPNDIERMIRETPSEARRWRVSSRAALVSALERGFRIAGFRAGNPPTYLLINARSA